ncbi:PP2C family protein-serine/threonine phosphatase [Rubritalea tangerina]|uniref:PP2C family protein-serine/threonine phosphatase n=1 Tax=Rubritalea tangerina TaxID=430798 RepID=A0ABW4ZA75_9BACT
MKSLFVELDSVFGETDTLVGLSLLFSTVLLFSLLISWRRMRAKLTVSEEQKQVIEGEEHRMFEFLHTLGIALEQDHSASKLHREIVDGLVDVVSARGGALYLLESTRRFLVPKAISDQCPLLIGLPVEVYKKAGGDVRALKSHVQLSKVPFDEGMLGAVLSSGVTQVVRDVKNHEAFRDAFVHYFGDVSAMVAPLKYGGRDLGVIAVARKHEDGKFTGNEFELFKSASEQAAFALGNAMIHQEAGEKRKIESELRTAQEVQQVLLPRECPKIHGYSIQGVNQPARLISGDYYDYIALGDGRWVVVIADVSGKGVAAGLLMAMCRSVLRSELMREKDALKAVSQLNRQLFPDIREDSFISLAVYVINEGDGKVQLVRAGHDKAPLLRMASGEVEWLKPAGLAIGLDDGDVFERVTKLYEFEIESGDTLLMYTDGVTEARNVSEDEFGEERMVRVLKQSASEGVEKVVSEMVVELKKFVDGAMQSDDITMIALQKVD